MATLKQSDIELRVHNALIALKKGTAEDDLVEFKGAWKDPILAARQLAGSANQAAGEPVYWVFGVDGSGGDIDLSSHDPADWWLRVMSRFDGQEPELIAHRSVEIQPGGTANAFVIGTDAAPYVVKSTKLDDDRLEIPIRTATATRSATRSQIMRMLAPSIRVPILDVLDAYIVAYYPKEEQGIRVRGEIDVFFDYPTNRDAATLPAHLATAVFHMEAAAVEWPLGLSIQEPRDGGSYTMRAIKTPPTRRAYNPVGVNYIDGGLTVLGPGLVKLRVSGEPVSMASRGGEVPSAWCGSARLEVRLGIAGSSRQATQTIELPGANMGPSEATFGFPGVRWVSGPR